MNRLPQLIRIALYCCLPLIVIRHGAVERWAYTAFFCLVAVLTVPSFVYWARSDTVPAAIKRLRGCLGFIAAFALLHLLSAWIRTAGAEKEMAVSLAVGSSGSAFPPSPDAFMSLSAILKGYFCVATLFCFYTGFQSREQRHNFMVFAALTALGVAIASLGHLFARQYGRGFFGSSELGFGPFICKNHYAGYMNTAIPAAWAIAVASRDKAKRILGMFIGAMLTASVLVSLSRAGTISMIVAGCAAVALARAVRAKGSWRSSAAILAVALAAGVLVWWIGMDPVIRRLSTLFNATETASFTSRFSWARDALAMVRDFPLLGAGPGSFMSTFGAYRTEPGNYLVDFLHNDYLQIVVEYGVAGAIVLGAGIIAYGIHMGRRAGLARTNRAYGGLWLASLSVAAAWAVHSYFDFNQHIPSNLVWVVLMIGLPFGLREQRAETGSVCRPVRPRSRALVYSVVTLLAAGLCADMYVYERRIDSALRYTRRSLRSEFLAAAVERRGLYPRGLYELGKTRFYEGMERRSPELLAASVSDLSRAAVRQPRNWKCYLRLGVARYHLSRWLRSESARAAMAQRALEDLRRSVALNRTNAMLWYYYGSYLVQSWHDFWEKDDGQLARGVEAMGVGALYDPHILTAAFTRVLSVDNSYTVLSRLVRLSSVPRMDSRLREASTRSLHGSFSLLLARNRDNVDFGHFEPEQEQRARALLGDVSVLRESGVGEGVRSTYLQVLDIPCSADCKIAAHTGLAQQHRSPQ